MDAAANRVAEVLDALHDQEARLDPLEAMVERISLAVTGVLVTAKVLTSIVHTVAPLQDGVATVMFLAAAIVATGLLGQLPTLVRLTREGVFPDRSDSARRHELAAAHASVQDLRAFPREALLETRRLVAARGHLAGRRVEYLIGSFGRLGMIPAIVMLLTAFSRLDGAFGQQAQALDAVHWAMIIAFTLYFAASVSEALSRRVTLQCELISAALDDEESPVLAAD